MVHYKSRVGGSLKKASKPRKLMQPAQEPEPFSAQVEPVLFRDGSTGGKISAAQAKKVSAVAKKVIANKPAIKKFVQRIFGASVPIGGALPQTHGPLSDGTIDQLDPHVFTHMLANMDLPTHNMLQGIASNYLGMEHPYRLITREALGGDYTFPKHLSKIAMRDVMKSSTPQQLAGALHSEIMDMSSGKLTSEEFGGGLFASLKTLVKRGIKGAPGALKSLGKGAIKGVQLISKGLKSGQMIGKSVSNALHQGIEVANALSPIIQTVFPGSKGVLQAGIGHVGALKELADRGIDLASKTEQAIDPVVQFANLLGPVDAPIVQQVPSIPVGAGLDMNNQDSGSDVSGERFVS